MSDVASIPPLAGRPGSRRHRAGALLACGLLACGCTRLGPGERESLQQASREYSLGRVDAAMARLDPLIRDFSRAEEIAEAHYIRGLCHARQGREDAARADFQKALNSRRRDVVGLARASLGTMAFQRGDYAAAAEHFEKGLPDVPDAPPKDQLLFSAGLAMQRAGRWKDAPAQFAAVLHRFPDRPIAERARRMAGWTHPYFAIQLAAYGTADSAEQAVRAYRSRGLSAVQENHPRGGRAMWIVMTGRYATYADAVAALPAVRRIQPDALIIP